MIRPITDTLRHIGGGVFIDIASDKLAFWFELIRQDKVLEAATQTLIAQIREKTGNPFFFGEPFSQ